MSRNLEKISHQLFARHVRGSFKKTDPNVVTGYCAVTPGLFIVEGGQQYEVALKTYKWASVQGPSGEKAKERTLKEVMVLDRLKSRPHRNINAFRGVIYATFEDLGVAPTSGVPSIATDWVTFDSIDYTMNIDFQSRLDIVVQLANGLAHLHDLDIVHGDLKPNNLRITSEGVVKIIDFGLSRCPGQYPDGIDFTTICPCFYFIAPELIISETGYVRMEVKKPSDVYAWSMTALQILDGRGERSLPFSSRHHLDVMREVLQSRWPVLDRYPGVVSQAVWDILQRFWTAQPTKRPTIRQALRDLDLLQVD